MHDPLVVAFEIRRPWPSRDRMHDSVRPDFPDRVLPRWSFKLSHTCAACDDEERVAHTGKRFFPWWKPSSWTPFWTVAGRGFYWPPLVTVWHQEPKGYDSGEICKHYVRWQDDDGKWHSKIKRGWRLHVHHWRLQIHPLQDLRRWLLTRCAWCGGRSRRGDYVNVSHGWDAPAGRWWRGAPGRFHSDCSSVERAHRSCTCDKPAPLRGDYGSCVNCGRFAAWGRTDHQLRVRRLLKTIPEGGRNPDIMSEVKEMWAMEQVRKEKAEAMTGGAEAAYDDHGRKLPPWTDRDTPERREERALWTRDIARMLREQTAVTPELRPGILCAANWLDPPVASQEVIDRTMARIQAAGTAQASGMPIEIIAEDDDTDDDEPATDPPGAGGSSGRWQPLGADGRRCVNDTDGDGDCAACARNPDAPCRQD